ncbi:hypothetical protein H9P43_008659 [Blastocladiella emersonii ATCC 22665]|nr:hypothetical protein H9P43_008659 [Blastocladiella emersonii ATCC 22665]
MKRKKTQRKLDAKAADPPGNLPVYPQGHPRNPYTHTPPDFAALAEKDTRLASFLIPIPATEGEQKADGRVTVDFGRADATVAATQALLRCDWGLDVEVPEKTLCPTVSSRLNYLLEIQDLVRWAGHDSASPAHILDIGTGYTAIYPLLGARIDTSWRFTGTDIDADTLAAAAANVERNGLGDRITLLPARDASGPFFPPDVPFTVAMCNPPYYASNAERVARAAVKATAHAATLGTDMQLVTEGGEVAFVRRMMRESKEHSSGDGKKTTLYTSLVGVKATVQALRTVAAELETTTFQVRTLRQGTTVRWVIAWSFDPTLATPATVKLLWADPSMYDPKMDTSFVLKYGGVRRTIVRGESDAKARGAVAVTTADGTLAQATWTRENKRARKRWMYFTEEEAPTGDGPRVRIWWSSAVEGRYTAIWVCARYTEQYVHSFYTWFKGTVNAPTHEEYGDDWC